MDFSGLDVASMELTIELLKQDLTDLMGQSKGKHVPGKAPDRDLMMQAYMSEIESFESLLEDRRMTSSIAQAVDTDWTVIQEEKKAERQAAQDRQLALHLNSHPNTKARASKSTVQVTAAPTSEADGAADDELLRKLQALYVGCPNEDELDQGESSSWAATRPKPKSPPPTSVCTSCGDQHVFYDVARCPCKHEYCRACMASLFEASLKDESLFPPRCCKQPIPVEPNQGFLPSELVGQFKARKVEFETPNRTYCHEPTCSTFIPVQFIRGDVASCMRCPRKTCTICKQASHRGDCPQDPAVQDLLRVAADNEWQRCYSCGRLIELHTGCHHMTCVCGAEFCYVCGRRWKTCRCRQWDENRLLARAEAVVDRDARPGLDAAGRARRIRDEANHLMRNHECAHERWRSRDGTFECEECFDTLPVFIYECRQCRIQVCRRCRFNRL